MSAEIQELLIVSNSVKFYDNLCSLKAISDSYQLSLATNLTDAKMKFMTSKYSIVIINTPLADGFGMDFAIELASSSAAGIILFTGADLFEKVKVKAAPYGIITIQKPTAPAAIIQAVEMLKITVSRISNLKTINDKLKNEIEELKTVNRAKLILMEHFGMSENEAHQYIHKRAMDMKETKKNIAANIIKAYAN